MVTSAIITACLGTKESLTNDIKDIEERLKTQKKLMDDPKRLIILRLRAEKNVEELQNILHIKQCELAVVSKHAE